MSLFYKLLYLIGLTPWEQMPTLPVRQQAVSLLDREERDREAHFGRALDLGCGTGFWSLSLARRGWEVTGIELVPKALRKARERARKAGVEVRFLEGSITTRRPDDPGACVDRLAGTPREPSSDPGFYSPERIRALFDEMASTYGFVNLISSFGFARRWRRQCLSSLTVQEGDVVADLMSGRGELWPSLARRVGSRGRILGVDLSPAMCAGSEGNRKRAHTTDVRVHVEDALSSSIESGSADCVVSTFGLKTFSSTQLARLAAEVKRMLKPGGRLAFLEISVPARRVLRWPYMAYLRQGIPLIGWLCLGNPDNYRHLGAYTTAFGDCSDFVACLRSEGLVVEARTFFFGCATGLVGVNPT